MTNDVVVTVQLHLLQDVTAVFSLLINIVQASCAAIEYQHNTARCQMRHLYASSMRAIKLVQNGSSCSDNMQQLEAAGTKDKYAVGVAYHCENASASMTEQQTYRSLLLCLTAAI